MMDSLAFQHIECINISPIIQKNSSQRVLTDFTYFSFHISSSNEIHRSVSDEMQCYTFVKTYRRYNTTVNAQLNYGLQ